MKTNNWKLSPSDFAFLWEECKRCFYLKVAKGFKRPYTPMPKIFIKIDLMLKNFFNGADTKEISPELQAGKVIYGEKWVESEPIVLPNCVSACYIRGKFDTVVRFDDGSYGVIDFKTSESKSEHIPLYSRQLHAYTYALENPAPGKFGLSPISKIGLLCIEPMKMIKTNGGTYSYLGKPVWIDCPRDDEEFLNFIREVLDILDQSEPPEGNPECIWCQYRDTSRHKGF